MWRLLVASVHGNFSPPSFPQSRANPHRRSRCRASPLYPRDDGKRGGIHRSAGPGRRGHGNHRAGCRVHRLAAGHASCLADGLVDRSLCRSGHCGSYRRHQSASRQLRAILRPRPEIRSKLCSAHCCGRPFDFRPFPGGLSNRFAGRVALALRNRDCNRGRVFRSSWASDGLVPDDGWRGGAHRARELGRCMDGRRLRRRANRIRLVDRTPLRRLAGIRMSKSSTARRENAQRSRERVASLETIRNPAREAVPSDLDRLIHERIRLGIVSALAVNRSLTFNELKALLKTTDGNLSVHALKLEEADYIVCTKSFDGRLPKTEYRLTAAGRKALERYLNHMEALIRATREG